MLPPHFTFRQHNLHCEDLPLAQLAEQFGTPLYVYSATAIRERALAYQQTATSGALTCYAVKANPNLHILRQLGQLGMGADVTSGGELFLAQQAGIPAERILYSGVGKTRAEIQTALQAGIFALHVESAEELLAVADVAQQIGCVARVGVRINPQVAAATHPYIRTGTFQYKFGVPATEGVQLLHWASTHPHLQPVGIAAHIGSQISEIEPFVQSAQLLCQLASELRAAGVPLEYVDVGGGLGIPYEKTAPHPAEWVQAVAQVLAGAGLRLVMEPGRSIVGPSGVLLTRVQYNKRNPLKQFVIVDAGMTELIRPTLYQAYHPITPIVQSFRPTQVVDIVGPICESSDYLARERELPQVQAGEVLAVMLAGAYGFAMSSNYNGHLRPAEVLVEGGQAKLIRRRETLADLLHTLP
ncbi:MAG TPA: diaminopimelate decarboxylase [Anaerolineales bacterium]|nr:diaminopimelate decarboxylase [Anaerolineales bacterium]